MVDLSVVIVTYNPGDLVLGCLRSVRSEGSGLSSEVIVVDNASQDGTPDRIRAEFPDVRLIVNGENRGFAAANNQGLRVARGRYLLILNPDVEVHPGALAAMVSFLESHPDVGIVGPRTYDPDGRVALTARLPLSVPTVLWQYLGLDRLMPYRVYGHYRRACEQAGEPFEVGWVQGSCLMLRRLACEQIGGFDEAFFLFAEEADLCQRAREAGWRVYYLPGAGVTHRESSSVSRYVYRKLLNHHISPLYYFRKRGRAGDVLALKAGFTLELCLKSLVRLLQMAGRRGSDARARLRAYWRVLGEVWRY